MKSKPRCKYLPCIHIALMELTRCRIEEALDRALASYFPSTTSRMMTTHAEFYDKYKREADEYNKDFIKKYDEDLDTTLIFVSEGFRAHVERIQWNILGRVVLRCDFSVHHRLPARYQRRFRPDIREAPLRPRSECQRHHLRRTRRPPTTQLATLRHQLHQRSMYDVCQSRGIGSRRLPRHAWKTVAQQAVSGR